MTTYEIISVVSAICALLVSAVAIFFNAIQTRRLTEANLMEQQFARSGAVIHFTSRFFDLIKDGEPINKFADPIWAQQFWSLQATEFYFFHHGMLPAFMYELWMIELAKMYSGPSGQQIMQSHIEFLDSYSFNYPDMVDFYNQLYETAKANADGNLRNRKVAQFVKTWCSAHKKSLLD
jgi:ABC-type multidrug transport system fused ATPase/permease subunit